MDLQGIMKSYISDAIADKVGASVGLTPEMSKSLVAKVLPLFTAKMANNAAQDESQAKAIYGAVKEDHDGSIFDNMSDLLAGSGDDQGAKILNNVFGAQTAGIEQAVAGEAHIEPAQAQGFMEKLAPLVMGAMGKEQSAQGLDMGSIMGMLGQAKQAQAEQKSTNPLLAMIDKDGDGVTDDLLKMGMSFLSKKA